MPTLTRPVRDAVSTTPKTSAAKAAMPAARGSRRSSSSATAAMAAHSSTLLRWLGWRRLPTARPTMLLAAIQSPSGQPGAKTCTRPSPRLASPVASQAQAKATKTASPSSALRAAAPACTTSAATPS